MTVATVGGQTRYTLELSRLYATDEAIGDGVSFYELDDFSVVVCRPGKPTSLPTRIWCHSTLARHSRLLASVSAHLPSPLAAQRKN